MAKKMTIQEWLAAPTAPSDHPAKAWLRRFLRPKTNHRQRWLVDHTLICHRRGDPDRSRFIVVGVAPGGRVELQKWGEQKTQPYHVQECAGWYIAGPVVCDLDGPWRIVTDSCVTGNLIPTIVDCNNVLLFSAHARLGVLERIVADHNAMLEPRIHDYEEVADTDDPRNDSRIADSEGWCLVDSDADTWVIQCDDDSDRFQTDDDAVEFVRNMARQHRYHCLAIGYHDQKI